MILRDPVLCPPNENVIAGIIATPVFASKEVAAGQTCCILSMKLTRYRHRLSLIQFRYARRQAMLTEGSKAPPFSLMDDHDHEIRLGDFAGKKNVVLFFFPKADTPG